MTKKQIRNGVLLIMLFLIMNIIFLSLGTFPRHILEGFRNYVGSFNGAILQTLINFLFWSVSILFIVFFCNGFTLDAVKNSQLKNKFLILLAVQIAIDICYWFIIYSNSLSIYRYVYNTVAILLNWLIMYHLLTPKRIDSSLSSKYKYTFIVFSIVITSVFVVLDFVDIAKSIHSLDSFSANAENGNYFIGIIETMYKGALINEACERRHLILDSIIAVLFFCHAAFNTIKNNS